LTTLLPRWTASAAACWTAALDGGLDWWSGAWTRPDAALDVVRWGRAMSRRQRPRWAHPHRVVLETPVARLRDYSAQDPGDVVPTLVFPPQAGHDSCIVDFSERQSQMAVIRAAGLERLFTLDWVGATAATRRAGIEDYLAAVDAAVDRVEGRGGPINLVGDCQGGWLATIWAALHPERVKTLTIAGAPIDFHAGEPIINAYVKTLAPLDLALYRALVALGGGVMRGNLMLGGFIAIRPENEIAKQAALLAQVGVPAQVARYAAFEDWFKHTQDIPGEFYLWIVQHLFRDNALVRGALEIGGERVDLGRIEAPLYLLGGADDHITPPAQVFALADHTSTPADLVARRITSGGHLGLFMGTQALRDHWPVLMADVYARSRRRRRRGSPLAARNPS
jgi:poly(3-hydroxybutyrate) depolymerase